MAKVDEAMVRGCLARVIREMKSQGLWNIERPAAEAFVDMGAFGMKTMAFAQWLRWMFVPNVERLLVVGGPWPHSSSVAVQAMREGDPDEHLAALVPALDEFDQLFR
jgi:uncharacterized protein YqcC (DUF446 family)